MKLNELMDLDSMKGQVDPAEMRRRIVKGGNDPFGKIAKSSKKDDKNKKADIKNESYEDDLVEGKSDPQARAYAALERKVRPFVTAMLKKNERMSDAALNRKIKAWLTEKGIDKKDHSEAHGIIIDMLGDAREMGQTTIKEGSQINGKVRGNVAVLWNISAGEYPHSQIGMEEEEVSKYKKDLPADVWKKYEHACSGSTCEPLTVYHRHGTDKQEIVDHLVQLAKKFKGGENDRPPHDVTFG